MKLLLPKLNAKLRKKLLLQRRRELQQRKLLPRKLLE
jgi:hypothetical protein